MSDKRGTAKKGLSLDDNRRRREDKTLAVRKDKKEESLMKRRQTAWPETEAVETPSSTATAVGVTGDASSVTGRQFTLSDVPEMMQLMQSQDVATQESALRGFRRLLSVEKNPPVQICIDCGALPLFVQFLQRSDAPKLQFEAAWALTNIASTDRTRVVVESFAIPHLAQLLNSPEADIREQAAWCLGNVAGDGHELRDVVIANNSMPFLLANIAQPANISLLHNCTWALSNFCRGKPAPPLSVVQPALPILAQILSKCTDEDTVVDATWAFSYISDGENERIQAVLDQGVVPMLVAMLHNPKHTVITPALRALGNIVSGSDVHTQAVVDANVMAAIVPLLGSSRKNIRKEACWMLSNVAAGTEAQLQQALSTAGLMQRVLEQMSPSAEWDVRKEAAWVVSNMATGGKAPEVAILIQLGAVKPLCELFETGDVRVVTIAMEAIECMLRFYGSTSTPAQLNVVNLMDECDGISKLEQLQEHENEGVYNKAVKLIETYFAEDGAEGESENLAPQVQSNNTFSFGLPSAQPAGKTAPFSSAFGGFGAGGAVQNSFAASF